MSSKDERTPIRKRWTSTAADAGAEATAGALFRAAMPFAISEKRLADVHSRLRRNTRREGRGRRSAGRLVGRLALAVVLVAALGGALSASVMHVLRARPPSTETGRRSGIGQKPVRHPSTRRPSTPEAKPEVPPDMPTPAPTPTDPAPGGSDTMSLDHTAATQAASPSHPPSPTRKLAAREPNIQTRPSPAQAIAQTPQQPAVPLSWTPPLEPAKPTWPLPPDSTRGSLERPVAVPMAAAPAQPADTSVLGRESRLLASAIAKLRQEGQPEQALRILDEYQVRFKSGTLAPEAATTRIEALLRLGRNDEALSLLDARHFDARGIGREMLVARAELRADRGRRAAALADFEAVLVGSSQTDGISERALYGRAICRAKAGDSRGARRDFESYLASFPNGRFANQARAAVDRIP